MVNVPKSLYARLTVGKKNAALLVHEYFRSRNISYVYIQIWSETYFDVFVV